MAMRVEIKNVDASGTVGRKLRVEETVRGDGPGTVSAAYVRATLGPGESCTVDVQEGRDVRVSEREVPV